MAEKAIAARAQIAADNSSGVQIPSASWVALSILSLVYAVNLLDRSLIGIVQEAIKNELSLTDTQLGFLSGFVFAVFYAVAGILVSRIADRRNRRNLIALSLLLWSTACAMMGFAQNYLQLLLTRACLGIGESGATPATHSLIADLFPRSKRGLAFGLFAAGAAIGSASGYAIGGYITQRFGWRYGFTIVGAAGLPLTLLLLLVREPVRGRYDPGLPAVEIPFPEAFQALRRNTAFLLINGGIAFQAIQTYAVGSFAPAFFIRVYHQDVATVGAAIAIGGIVSGIAGGSLGGVLSDRLGANDPRWYPWTTAAGTILSVLFFLLAFLSRSFFPAIVFFNVALFCFNLSEGPVYTVIQNAVPVRLRALASAVFHLVLNLVGLGVGPLLTGILSDHFSALHGVVGIRYALICMQIAGPISALLYFCAGPAYARIVASQES